MVSKDMFSLFFLSALILAAVALECSAAVRGDYLPAMIDEGVVRWPENRMPLRVYIAEQNEHTGYDAILRDSFREWAKCSNGLVRFRFVESRREADVTVDWLEGQDHLAYRQSVADARIFQDVSGIAKAQINLALERRGSALTEDNVKKMCLYTVGRILGMYGRTADPGDIMYDQLTGDGKTAVSLSERDCRTLTRLYSLKTGVPRGPLRHLSPLR